MTEITPPETMNSNGYAAGSSSILKATHVKADRSEVVLLDWPIEFAGRVWDAITVRRMTAADIQVFQTQMDDARKSGLSGPARFPMFDAPAEVLDALDIDDIDKLDEVSTRFLPHRYRADPV